jgi:hypothetical protein
MKKQTAVEWLHSEYIKIFGELNPSTGKLYEIAYALKQAKQMERQQIEFTYNIGWADGHDEATNESPLFTTGEQYYKETYGGTQC